MLSALLLSVPLFAATNLDDLFILLALFAHPRLRPRSVVAGQFLGIGVLFVASVALAMGARLLPGEWIGLLGLLPIALGLRELLGGDDDDDDLAGAASRAGAGTAAGALVVAGITLANGGDNLGVWAPAFAVHDAAALAVIAVAFALMTGLLCFAALRLVTHPAVGVPLRRHVARWLPWLLIAIGVWILVESRSYALLGALAPGAA